MTDRILDLADEANVSQLCRVDGDWGSKMSPELQKFAELIVKECVNVCLSQRDPTNLNYKPSESFARAINMHFGLPQ